MCFSLPIIPVDLSVVAHCVCFLITPHNVNSNLLWGAIKPELQCPHILCVTYMFCCTIANSQHLCDALGIKPPQEHFQHPVQSGNCGSELRRRNGLRPSSTSSWRARQHRVLRPVWPPHIDSAVQSLNRWQRSWAPCMMSVPLPPLSTQHTPVPAVLRVVHGTHTLYTQAHIPQILTYTRVHPQLCPPWSYKYANLHSLWKAV